MTAANEQRVRVLFVDDEENIIKALRRMFMDEEFEVLTAASGAEGLELIRDNENIGLIVSDQRMPGMDGVDFLAEARKLVPDAIRIILTGYADINAAMGAINRGGAFRYLTKPWQDDDLVQNIREAVELFKLKRENRRLNAVVQKQNLMLEEWNSRLKTRVLEQTRELRKKNDELKQVNTKLKNNYSESITMLSSLVEMRSKTSYNHSRKVAELAQQMAQNMGLVSKDTEVIYYAGLLHDIGKVGISDLLLNKNVSSMNTEEMSEYMRHSVRGQAAVDSIEDLRDAGILIRHHHEKFNGTGQPDKLHGKNIPLGARIISMVDFIEHQIGPEPNEKNIFDALEEIKKLKGVRFDPELLPILNITVNNAYQHYLTEEDEEELVEVEISSQGLQSGMVLARRIVSGTGLLLLQKGSVFNNKNIQVLQRLYSLDPPVGGIYIWMKKNELGQR